MMKPIFTPPIKATTAMNVFVRVKAKSLGKEYNTVVRSAVILVSHALEFVPANRSNLCKIAHSRVRYTNDGTGWWQARRSVLASPDSYWPVLNLRVAHLDLNGRESGQTPILHALLIEPNGRRRRYPQLAAPFLCENG
jgi:hypothetical protein